MLGVRMTLARNILTTLTARIFVLGLSLVSSMVLARALGPEGRGLFALVLLLPELARTFGLLGFEQANAVYAGLEPGGRRALAGQSLMVASVAGGLTALAGISYIALGAPGLGSTLHGPIWLYVLALLMVPGRLLIDFWLAVLRGMNRITALNLVEVGTKVASLLLVLVWVVGIGTGVQGAVWADSAMVAATVLILGVLLARSGALGRPWFDRCLWGRTTRFALPAYGSGIMTYLNYRVDQLVIAVMLPPEELAFYVIAVDIAERLWIIPGAVSTALLPHLTNSKKRDPALVAAVARHATIWMGLGCLLVWAVAGVAVELIYSSAYGPTVAPLRWLLPGIFALTIGKVLVAELLAREKIRFAVWLSLGGASVNAVANYWLIPRMGLSGASLASSLSYTIVSLGLICFYVRETGVSWGALLPRRDDLLVYIRLCRPRERGVLAQVPMEEVACP
ncbi:polysaccharide biosynthesis C-terminal domain-containing protein (plasmid) [Tundrisphaera lichenicola]|uniref:oligosaccharide flippase family protein n=1 Tax=Tundrisphaera lichenicola TaxID=2029860 RepID=UPI003EBEDF28